jgi:hypothetical protein
MVGAIQGGKGIDEAFKTAIARTNGGTKESDMDAAVSGLTSDYVAAQVRASPNNRDPIKYTNDVNSAIGRYAKQLYIKDPSRSIDDVAKESYNTFIGPYVNPTKVAVHSWQAGSSRDTNLMLPSQIALPSGENKVIGDSDKANIQTNLKAIMSEEGLKSLNPIYPTTAAGEQSPQADQFIPQVQRTWRGTYVNTLDGPGVQIWYQTQKKNSNGVTTPSDQLLHTKDKFGQETPALIPIERLLKTPPQQEGFIPGVVHSIGKFMGLSN